MEGPGMKVRRQRLYVLSAWRETSFFTNRQRAALAWSEALTFGFATATHAQQVNTLLTKQLPEAPGKEIK